VLRSRLTKQGTHHGRQRRARHSAIGAQVRCEHRRIAIAAALVAGAIVVALSFYYTIMAWPVSDDVCRSLTPVHSFADAWRHMLSDYQIWTGRWLGMLIAAGGMASALGLYSAVLLSVSRVPKVMADDQLLPSWLCAQHRRFNTPYVSIIASSAIVSILILFTFSELVVMDIILYGAGLTLEFLTLLTFRRREPLRPRPFRIPLNHTGLLLMVMLPVGVYVIALSGAIWSSEKMAIPVVLALVMLASAELAWRLVLWRNPHLATSPGTVLPD